MDQAILDSLEQHPFSSLRELARLTYIPTTTIHRHLMQSLDFTVKDLRWVPHTLTPTRKPERATLLIELLRQLRLISDHPTFSLRACETSSAGNRFSIT
jgi:hypothetical protein